MSSSGRFAANERTVSLPRASQYETWTRSAWKPRSCSPMGPAPTRDPRIALPPDATVFPCLVRLEVLYAPLNLVMRPRTTMQLIHTTPRITVIRFKLRSATPDAPRLDVTPPPNISERPP